MRISFQLRRKARRPTSFGPSLAVLAAVAPSVSNAFNFTSVPPSNLDFSNLGKMGIAGDFDGISLYEFKEQIAQPLSTNGSEYLLAQLPNGALAPIASTDASILAMCPLTLSDGSEGVILGGNFTSINGTKSTAMALYNTNTSTFTPLDGLEGEVNAILCDSGNKTVYVGGNFKGGNSTNAIAWLVDSGWANLPFAGFNGPVSSITKASNGHIIFGGSFTGLGNVSAPSQLDGQAINLSTANISADNTASTAGFNNAKNIICSDGTDGSGKTWLLNDNVPGSWEAAFNFGFEPTKLRLWNTHQDGRGTKTFRFLAFPINGILNLTYIDPATGRNATCTSECPLSNDSNVKFQDFHFVNRVGMNRFQIAISDWYGKGAGLNGIELLQDDIFSFAVKDFNEPTCGVDFPSTATATGPWTQSPSLQSDSQYLTAKLEGPITSKSASVVFIPNIKESGNYSVNMYTPGCIPDNTCLTRGRVNITGIMSTGSIESNFTTSLYQTNNFEKYDQIYFGYIDQTSDSFKPSVTITPLDGQDLSQMTFVAQKVGFSLINSTGGLNGLFDFDATKAVINTTNLDNSAVNELGSSFDHNTGVKALATAGDVTYIGGNFTSKNHQNFVALNTDNNTVLSLDGGLNGEVFDMHLQGIQLFVGGDFTNKRTNSQDGLSHVAVLDTDNNSWSALGAGVDGRVEHVVPFQVNLSNTNEAAIAFTGSFSQIKAFGNFDANPVNGFAVWILSKQNWLENLAGPIPNFGGMLTSSQMNLTSPQSLFAGSIASSELGVNGAATLTDQGFGSFPVDIQAQTATSSKRRRDLSQLPTSGVVAGAFYDGSGNNNITVLAGHFTARASNGSTINNLILIDGKNNNSVSGLGSSISPNSAFTSVAFRDTVLFAAGNISGNVDGSSVNGLIAYDVSSKAFVSQPASVSGGNNTVSVVTVRPGTAEVYAGGSFSQAGALDCPGVCMYNADSRQWSRPGNSLAGRVDCFMWYSKTQLLAGGDLRSNGSDANYLAIYDTSKQTWKDFAGSGQIPGPVTAITPGSSDNGQIWVSGLASSDQTVFLMKYDGSQWQSAKQLPPPGSVIRSLQVFSLTKAHDSTDLLDENQVLMLTGSIPIPNVGLVSAVIYNGSDYQPYALTTSGGGAGSIARIFSQNDNFFTTEGSHLALVFVVLIGLAVSLGIIVILVVAGIILDRLRKKREGYTPAPTSMYDRGSGIQRIPPRELLEQLGRSQPGAPPHI